MKEKNAELDIYWELGVVEVVLKDRMMFNLGDKTVKGQWLNPKLVTKAFRAINPPVI